MKFSSFYADLQALVQVDDTGSFFLKGVKVPGKTIDPTLKSFARLTEESLNFFNLGVVQTAEDTVCFTLFPVRGVPYPQALPFERSVAASLMRVKIASPFDASRSLSLNLRKPLNTYQNIAVKLSSWMQNPTQKIHFEEEGERCLQNGFYSGKGGGSYTGSAAYPSWREKAGVRIGVRSTVHRRRDAKGKKDVIGGIIMAHDIIISIEGDATLIDSQMIANGKISVTAKGNIILERVQIIANGGITLAAGQSIFSHSVFSILSARNTWLGLDIKTSMTRLPQERGWN